MTLKIIRFKIRKFILLIFSNLGFVISLIILPLSVVKFRKRIFKTKTSIKIYILSIKIVSFIWNMVTFNLSIKWIFIQYIFWLSIIVKFPLHFFLIHQMRKSLIINSQFKSLTLLNYINNIVLYWKRKWKAYQFYCIHNFFLVMNHFLFTRQ